MHEIHIGEDLRGRNREIAAENKKMLSENGVFALNIMSAPGAGKTSLLESTIPLLADKYTIGVIEGDLQTSRDADRIRKLGIDVFQIQTGGACHLDAAMVHSALHKFNLESLDIMLIENVGNLVCPAEFELGEDVKAMLLSVSEGDDKPKKYPLMFSESDILIFNKIDLLPHVDFDIDRAENEARDLNADIETVRLSCRTGEGMQDWIECLEEIMGRKGER